MEIVVIIWLFALLVVLLSVVYYANKCITYSSNKYSSDAFDTLFLNNDTDLYNCGIPLHEVYTDKHAANLCDFIKQTSSNKIDSSKLNGDFYSAVEYKGWGGGGDHDTHPWGYIIFKNGEPFKRTELGYDPYIGLKIEKLINKLNNEHTEHTLKTYEIQYMNGRLFVIERDSCNNYIHSFEAYGNTFNSALYSIANYLSPYKNDAFGIIINADNSIGENLMFKSIGEFRQYINNS